MMNSQQPLTSIGSQDGGNVAIGARSDSGSANNCTQGLNSNESQNQGQAHGSSSSSSSGGGGAGIPGNRLTFAEPDMFLNKLEDRGAGSKYTQYDSLSVASSRGGGSTEHNNYQVITKQMPNKEQQDDAVQRQLSVLGGLGSEAVVYSYKEGTSALDQFAAQQPSANALRSYSECGPYVMNAEHLPQQRFSDDQSYIPHKNYPSQLDDRSQAAQSLLNMINFTTSVLVPQNTHHMQKGQPQYQTQKMESNRNPAQVEPDLAEKDQPLQRSSSESSSSSGGMSSLQDAMFSKLLRNKPQPPINLVPTSIEEAITQVQCFANVDQTTEQILVQDSETIGKAPIIEGANYKQDLNLRAVNKESQNIIDENNTATNLLQAVIICDLEDIEKIVKSNPEQQHDDLSNKDDEPVFTYEDTPAFCRSESMLVHQSIIGGALHQAPASPTENAGVTQFDNVEYQQLIRQYHKLRQEQQVMLGNKQNESAFDQSVISQMRTLSIDATGGNIANPMIPQLNLNKNNQPVFQNESKQTHVKRNEPSQIKSIFDKIHGSNNDVESSIRLVVESYEDKVLPKKILEQIRIEDSSPISIDELRDQSPMGVPLKSQSSSDSFSSLSADIQNVITNTLKGTIKSGNDVHYKDDSPLPNEDHLSFDRHNSIAVTSMGLQTEKRRTEQLVKTFTPMRPEQLVGSEHFGNSVLLPTYPITTSSMNAQKSGSMITTTGPQQFLKNSSNSQNSHLVPQHSGGNGSFFSNSTGKFDHGSRHDDDRISGSSNQNKSSQLRSQKSGQYSSPERMGSINWGQNEIGIKQSFIGNDTMEQLQPSHSGSQPWWYNQYQQNLQSVNEEEMTFDRNSSHNTPSFKNQILRGNTLGSQHQQINDPYSNMNYLPMNGSIGANVPASSRRSEVVLNPQSFGTNQRGVHLQQAIPVASSWGGIQPQVMPPPSFQEAQAFIPAHQQMQSLPAQYGGRHGAVNQTAFDEYQQFKQASGGFMPHQANHFMQQQLQHLTHQGMAPSPNFKSQLAPPFPQKSPSFVPGSYSHSQIQPPTTYIGHTPYGSTTGVPQLYVHNSLEMSANISPVEMRQSISSGSSGNNTRPMPSAAGGPTQLQTPSITMINQLYKTIMSEEQKLAFLIQHSYTLSKDQAGCRRLQKKIDEQIEKNNEKGMRFAHDMLNNLLPMIAELMMDSFANYLIQKLNKLALDSQIDQIFTIIRPNFLYVANNKHGTRALQNLLKSILPLTDRRSLLISESLKQTHDHPDLVLVLALNLHGNHVIQLCLDHLTLDEHKASIYNTVLCNCAKIATDKHGCCVVQKILGTHTSKIQRALVNVSIGQLDQLINDQFGNYVVQQILKYNNKEINVQVASFICENLSYYCTQKISSNVVESAVRSPNSPESQILFFHYLVKNTQVLKDLMFDPYGNYVIQAIFQQAREYPDQTYFNQFFMNFQIWTDDLAKVSFGKKFITKILQMAPSHLMGAQSTIDMTEETPKSQSRFGGATDQSLLDQSVIPQDQSNSSKFQKLKNQASKGFKNLMGGKNNSKDGSGSSKGDQGYLQSSQLSQSYQMGGGGLNHSSTSYLNNQTQQHAGYQSSFRGGAAGGQGNFSSIADSQTNSFYPYYVGGSGGGSTTAVAAAGGQQLSPHSYREGKTPTGKQSQPFVPKQGGGAGGSGRGGHYM